MIVEQVAMPMPDGVRLAADLYRPVPGQRLPALLMRTPYDRRKAETMLFAHPAWYAAQGFAVVIQDVRGRFDSGGAFEPWVSEAVDGQATIEWIASQPWCDGRVAMYGFSYPGSAQLLAAAGGHPALHAVMPVGAPLGLGEGVLHAGGAFALGFALGWALDLALDPVRRLAPQHHDWVWRANDDRASAYAMRPLLDHPIGGDDRLAPWYREWIRHAGDESYWAARTLPSVAGIGAAALFIGGWQDGFVRGTLDGFAGAPADRSGLLVGPWVHYPNLSAVPDHGPDSPRTIETSQLGWLDRWLRDTGPVAPRVRIRWTGGGWEEADTWPPVTTSLRLHLRSGGRAHSRFGDGRLTGETSPPGEPPDTLVHDPGWPVVVPDSAGPGYPLLTPAPGADQSSVEASNRVLVYTSAPLESDLEVAGVPRAHLVVDTTAASADWVVTLCDVSDTGVSRDLTRGIIRTGPGATVGIDLGPIAHRFVVGHRVRLQVSGSAYPVWEPNPGTGHPLGVDGPADLVVAHNTLHHDGLDPSWLDLPVRR